MNERKKWADASELLALIEEHKAKGEKLKQINYHVGTNWAEFEPDMAAQFQNAKSLEEKIDIIAKVVGVMEV